VNNTAGEETIQVSLTVTGEWVWVSLCVCRDGSKKKMKRVLKTLLSSPLANTAPLTAHLQPQVQTVDVDKDAQFQCIVSGHPVHDVNWLHDGKPILRDNRVEVSRNSHIIHNLTGYQALK